MILVVRMLALVERAVLAAIRQRRLFLGIAVFFCGNRGRGGSKSQEDKEWPSCNPPVQATYISGQLHLLVARERETIRSTELPRSRKR
ncbi:MAG TPA: hypothetical protein VFV38_04165 [Ktedonobacteraceae bacterium]|nr:hypothetical protein [Ktedonobacteraceae bacterium]